MEMTRKPRITARKAPWTLVIDTYDRVLRAADVAKIDVCKPGFFNEYRSELTEGTMIDCRIGGIEDGITRVSLMVIDCPQSDLAGDVLVAVGESKKYTPCRHDGKIEVAA